MLYHITRKQMLHKLCSWSGEKNKMRFRPVLINCVSTAHTHPEFSGLILEIESVGHVIQSYPRREQGE